MNDLTVLSDAELDAVAGGFVFVNLNVSHNKVNGLTLSSCRRIPKRWSRSRNRAAPRPLSSPRSTDLRSTSLAVPRIR